METVKKAEDCERTSDGLVLRLYETAGRRTETRLHFQGISPAAGEWVDLLERPADPAWSETGGLIFGPFEIHTIKLTFENER